MRDEDSFCLNVQSTWIKNLLGINVKQPVYCQRHHRELDAAKGKIKVQSSYLQDSSEQEA